MSYIKKSELKGMLKNKLEAKYCNIGFKLISNKNRLYKNLNGGLLMLDYKIDDAYNFEKNEIAWGVEVYFFIGFEVVHKWFEPFENRNRNDYKYYWTYGNSLDNITGNKFQVDVDEPNIERFLENLIDKVDVSFKRFFEANKDLSNLYHNKVPVSIKNIDDVKNMRSFNMRTAIEILTIARILNEKNFEELIELFKYRIKELVEVGDPMAKHLYPKFNEIIETLKIKDFSNSILSLKFDSL